MPVVTARRSVACNVNSMVSHERLLCIPSQFSLHLLGVDEFVSSVIAGIKPGHDSCRLPISPFSKRDCSPVRHLSSLDRDGLNGCNELGAVRVKNEHHIPG